jgi:hypothetical protein
MAPLMHPLASAGAETARSESAIAALAKLLAMSLRSSAVGWLHNTTRPGKFLGRDVRRRRPNRGVGVQVDGFRWARIATSLVFSAWQLSTDRPWRKLIVGLRTVVWPVATRAAADGPRACRERSWRLLRHPPRHCHRLHLATPMRHLRPRGCCVPTRLLPLFHERHVSLPGG